MFDANKAPLRWMHISPRYPYLIQEIKDQYPEYHNDKVVVTPQDINNPKNFLRLMIHETLNLCSQLARQGEGTLGTTNPSSRHFSVVPKDLPLLAIPQDLLWQIHELLMAADWLSNCRSWHDGYKWYSFDKDAGGWKIKTRGHKRR